MLRSGILPLICLSYIVNVCFAHLESKTNSLFDTKLFRERSKRSLSICKNTREARSIQENAALRRQKWFNALREERAIKQSSSSSSAWDNTILSTNHQSNQTGLTSSSNPFASTSTCVLNPEGEVGPYWVKGELIRSDIRETQPGVDLFLDIQVIDTNCKPVTNLYLDIWHCNSTGVYSGVSGNGNGNANDASIINATYHRGLQPSNSNGYATYTTKFPGHYQGRTTHIHMIAHLNGQVLSNGTYSGGTMAHIGQMFFDQSLIDTVEATSPYNTNTQIKTPNSQDNVVNAQEGMTVGSDPFVNYVMLGSGLQSGIFAWITLVVDPSVDHTSSSSYASLWTANGGVSQNNGMGGFPGQGPNGYGGPGGPGGPPPGGFPPGGPGGMPPPGTGSVSPAPGSSPSGSGNGATAAPSVPGNGGSSGY